MEENNIVNDLKTVKAVVETGAAAGAAVSAATGLSVAATSGAGITSGLAAAGGVVGGGMAAAPAVLAAGPAYAGAKIINSTFFKDELELSEEERNARAIARTATNMGAAAGVAGAGAVTVAAGASGAAIMSTLAGIGGVVGGGAIAGTAIVALAPVAVAGAMGGYTNFSAVKGNSLNSVQSVIAQAQLGILNQLEKCRSYP